ncbi:MAG: DNA recombination protein RmuC [Rhodobacteraceae bacterium]|nr:DNA recombination protein RmuC [Paracoccaceae bacterium]
MMAQLIADLQASPDWIKALLVALALAALWAFANRRKAALARADAEVMGAQGQAEGYEAQLAELVGELRETQGAMAEAREENVRLETSLELQHANNAEKLALLNENGEHLKAEFKALAGQVMDAHGERFERQNSERLKMVLQPLKEHIGKFEAELRGVHEAAGKDRVALKHQIETLTKQSAEVSLEAHNLTKALKGDQQKQGAWGEMVLASILERSGLREGEEYEVQSHYRGDEGQAFRPDVVVNLPGGRRLVVDSKVSLVAYERAVNAEDSAARAANMKLHVGSVKTHIDTLSAKKYHEFDDGSVDYVILFMPIESAFSEAVKASPDLSLYASERNIVIASPTNLMVALKTVDNLWSIDRRNKNAMDIAKRAGLLYDKFVGFTLDMEKVGERLTQAQTSHAAAISKLSQGSGNLVGQVETLKVLGAKAAKQIGMEHEGEPPQIG